MTAISERKLAENRLKMLTFADTLGNVSEACRKLGISRSQFYESKKRFEQHGLEGLRDLPPIHKTHPQTTTPEVVEQVGWGCQKISAKLKQMGIGLSAVTVQDMLTKHGLGTRSERLYALEKRHLEEGAELTGEQVQLLEKHNPCFRERHVESAQPGELLSADTTQVCRLPGVGRVMLHAVVDTYGSYALGFLHPSKQPEASAFLLHEYVMPFYQQHGLTVGAVLTDNGREFCGTDAHPYELYLDLQSIAHRFAADQWLCGTLHPYGQGGVLCGGPQAQALPHHRRATSRLRDLAGALQHGAPASGLSKPGRLSHPYRATFRSACP